MVEYADELEDARRSAGALNVFATLSTAANSEVNKEATTKIGISSGVSMRGSVGLSGYLLDLAAKGTYYLNCKTGQASISAIVFKGSEQKTRIRAVCGYL
jgi:exonuclease VII large subunit